METAAAFAERQKKASTSVASISIPAKSGISTSFQGKSYKVEIPSTLVASGSTSKPIVVKTIGNFNTVDGKPIRFIPPKVNTANNRVPPNERLAGGSGEKITNLCVVQSVLVLTAAPMSLCSLFLTFATLNVFCN